MSLPEQFIEGLRAKVTTEDVGIFDTCRYVADGWEELGLALTELWKQEEGWTDKEAPRKAHSRFITSSAAHVGKSAASIYDRKRVGVNILAYNLHEGENENLTYGHWVALMRNVDESDEGIVPQEIIEERLEWVHDETDKNFGQPPSTRDIEKHYRSNGHKPEWLIHWKAVVRNAKKVKESNSPNFLRNAIHVIEKTEEERNENSDIH